MMKTNSATAVKHAAQLSAYQLAAIPATNSTNACVIARAELANLWTPTDCWTEGVLLELAEYIENHAYTVTGRHRYALFDVTTLAEVMGNKSAAMLVCRLAGGYLASIGGKQLMVNRDGEDSSVLVTFPDDFVRTFWTYMTDEMEHVLNIHQD